MVKETITQVILKPDEGMRLTDGKTFAEKIVILPEGADDSAWYEITEEEYTQAIAEQGGD